MPPPVGEPPLIRRCAWCRRRHCKGEWVTDVEPLDPERTTSTICPQCADELSEEEVQPHTKEHCS